MNMAELEATIQATVVDVVAVDGASCTGCDVVMVLWHHVSISL